LLVPSIYTFLTIAPSIISYLKVFDDNEEAITIKFMLPMIIMGILITFKAPIVLGIYFIKSSLFNLFEDIGFKIYSKNKVF
jgi:inner membrane insertion protein